MGEEDVVDFVLVLDVEVFLVVEELPPGPPLLDPLEEEHEAQRLLALGDEVLARVEVVHFLNL